MDERTTVEKRTTVVSEEPAESGSTNVNIDTDTGATTIQTNEPAPRQTARETTVERTTRS